MNLGTIGIKGIYVGSMPAAQVYFGDIKVWPEEPEPVTNDWLCFTAQQPNSTVRLDKSSSSLTNASLETSYNGNNWVDYSWTGVTGDTLILANIGDKVYMRAKNENIRFSSSSSYYQFKMTGTIAASGNIQTLLKADGSRTDVPSYCLNNLFSTADSLIQAPTLPATTLAEGCYRGMFFECTSLTAIPYIAAQVIPSQACQGMFSTCTSLTSAEIYGTNIASSGYRWLFDGCTNLSSITVHFTTWQNTNDWVNNVSPTGTFYCPTALGTNETIIRGVSNCPANWTVINTDKIDHPLCFTAEGSNASVTLIHGSNAPSISMEYSIDNATWNNYTLGTTITLASKGDKVYFRATDVNAGMGYSGANNWQAQYNNWFDCQNVSVSGKIVSVLRKDMDESLTYTTRDGVYRSMFRNFNNRNPQIVNAKDLKFPQLSSFSAQAFMGIFASSTLSAAPTLPTNCTPNKESFAYFFENCDKLSSIENPMMTITGFTNDYTPTTPPLNNIFNGMDNFNQEELVLVLSGIADYSSYSLNNVFISNTSFTGKFILDMTSYAFVPTIQSNTFNNSTKPTNGTLEIHVPASLYDAWKVATNWTNMSSYLVPVS